MFCKRAILVNWGNIPSQEFEFGPINLFSGGNGSGKTTAADALQSLMTAAHENLFNFNPGQDETTQRGRGGKNVRTLPSYVLGCDDGSYARLRPTDGYVAGIFHPTDGETSSKFTAIMCIRASLDSAGTTRQARLDDLQFLIIPNEELFLDDIVKQDKGGKYITPMNDLPNLLKKRFGRSGVEIYDKKGPYLRRLYGIFRDQKGATNDREAKHAARTFSNFMAYKPVKSITEFVAREILEPKDLSDDIRQVSELMKTIHSMEEDTRRVNEAVGNLEHAQTCAQYYVDNWIQHRITHYTEHARQHHQKQEEYLKLKNQKNTFTQSVVDIEHAIQLNDEKHDALLQEHVELLAKRQGIDVLKNKDQLERDIQSSQTELGQLVGPLLVQDQQFSRNVHAASELLQQVNSSALILDAPTLNAKQLSKLLKPVIEAGSDTGIDAQSLQTKDWIDNSALEDKLHRILQLESQHNSAANYLHDGENSASDQLYTAFHRKNEQREKLKKQITEKQFEVQNLEQARVSYPAHVEHAIAALNEICPETKPAVLCDFIEVLEPEWQMAIEGYLGGARFGIVVEPEFEAEAIRIVRSLPGRRNNARVIQGSKAQRDAAKLSLPAKSVVDIMRFDHKIVEYYMHASYGNVVRVDSADALKRTARGLTEDGMGSGNYSLFRCDIDEGDLVFGTGARERALYAKQKQLQSLLQTAQELITQCETLSHTRKMLNDIQAVHCSETIRSMLKLYRNLQKAESDLKNLDLSDFTALEERLITLKFEIKEIESASRLHSEQLGRLHESIEQNARVISRTAREQDTLQNQLDTSEKEVTGISRVYVTFSSEKALESADHEAKSSLHSLEHELEDIWRKIELHERHLYEAVLEHNRHAHAATAITYLQKSTSKHDTVFFGEIVAVQKEIQRVYNALKNNVLVGKHEKLLALRDSFNTTFVTNLCHSIYQSINDGKRILDELNNELKHHRFGADRERFYFAYEWLPEFREYWRFFDEIIKNPSLGDGKTLFDAELSEKSAAVRDKMLSMLLDNNEQSALIELKRMSDYRNYRRYEIFKEPENKEPIPLSTYGTGSGGQLETPAYIIRSAAITSAFRFNEGQSHCRMVLVDEAFSKMDETRSREVIHYLTETLGLQLLFIMPSSKSGPFMDLISHQVVFSKCPTQEKIGELNTRVLVDRKTCNSEKIKALWANHRHTIRHQSDLDFMEDFT